MLAVDDVVAELVRASQDYRDQAASQQEHIDKELEEAEERQERN